MSSHSEQGSPPRLSLEERVVHPGGIPAQIACGPHSEIISFTRRLPPLTLFHSPIVVLFFLTEQKEWREKEKRNERI